MVELKPVAWRGKSLTTVGNWIFSERENSFHLEPLVTLSQAQEAVRAARAEERAEWLPIDSAPRDGSEFIAFGHYFYPGDEGPTVYTEVASYSGDPEWPWEDAEGVHRVGFYSHWMPLPAPPALDSTGGADA